MVAIAHVTQRNAVKGKAQLILIETADGYPGRPFIIAERIGGLDVDARQFLYRPDRTDAGGKNLNVGCIDFLHLAGLALAKHHNLAAALGNCFDWKCHVLSIGRTGDRGA